MFSTGFIAAIYATVPHRAKTIPAKNKVNGFARNALRANHRVPLQILRRLAPTNAFVAIFGLPKASG
jgi:hypothetical protein